MSPEPKCIKTARFMAPTEPEGFAAQVVAEYDKLRERIQALEQQLRQVDDALVVRWITVKDGDYKKAINDLITWEIQVRDDPAVSTHARDVQKLVDAARDVVTTYTKLGDHYQERKVLAEALKPFPEQEKR